MRIAIGSDHRGFKTKQSVISLVSDLGHEYRDFGCYSEQSVDYPDIARQVAGAVARGEFERGILICGTGIGMSIAANKVNGIRAALCLNVFCAQRARQHNNANVLCMGAETTDDVAGVVRTFLDTGFEGGRHQDRLDKIAAIEA